MRRVIILSLLGFSFIGCQQAPASNTSSLHPFVGCWETENGLERESWALDPSGWLIGYAVSRDAEGNVTFFEHMRIERGGDSEVLVVTGQDNSEARFTRRQTDDAAEYRFENPDHDYPQVIAYKRNGDALNAYIDLMDGSQKISFDKSLCKEN
ncbi:DUF6265 family protein [Hellea sp.]|nr:DUF6265 family protein [Hellea sp.]